MASPLLHKKNPRDTQVMTIEEAVAFLKNYFKELGYSSRSQFCDQHNIKYSTMNAILNYKSNKSVQLPVRKIPVIFEAIGYDCGIQRTVEFHVKAKLNTVK